jgi:hypothetical protein
LICAGQANDGENMMSVMPGMRSERRESVDDGDAEDQEA